MTACDEPPPGSRESSIEDEGGSPQASGPGARAAVRLRAVVRVILALAFCAVGIGLGWWQLWLFLIGLVIVLGGNLLVMARYNPELIAQRMKPDRPVERFDRWFFLSATILMLAFYAVAAADALHFRSFPFPWEWSVAALAVFLIGDLPVMASLKVNPYLERTARHQEERGQQVVTTGLYRFVRHPMYTGVIIMLLALPVLLGSLVAMIPAVLLAGLFVVRTHHEDWMLRHKLEGYEQYARETPYRLVPGLW